MPDEFVSPTYSVPNIKWYDNPQTQAQKRRHHTMADQFGRDYETTLDMTCKPHPAPCSTINPLGWRDPLNTPAKYIVYDGKDFFRVRINVEQWEADLTMAHAEWRARLTATAASMSPKDGGAALLGDGINDISPHLLDQVGEKPQPVEFVQALIAGNKWARGQDTNVPLWAKKLMPIVVLPASRTDDLDALKAQFPDADEEAARERMAKARAAKAEKALQESST